jgi:uncharacterized protein
VSSASPLPPPPPGAAYAPQPIATHAPDVRARFMKSVYLHLLAGIVGFVAIESFLFASGLARTITEVVIGTNWLLILGGFMIVSYLSNSITAKARTRGSQYGGYALLVAANAVLFATPLYIAASVPELEGTISTAAWISIVAFAGLSGVAITTGKDFGFLKGIVRWGMILALVAIVAAVVTGTALGTLFITAMIGLAGAAILYETQQIYRTYPPGLEVPAAMTLFSSLALLFWYVLQLLMRR